MLTEATDMNFWPSRWQNTTVNGDVMLTYDRRELPSVLFIHNYFCLQSEHTVPVKMNLYKVLFMNCGFPYNSISQY